MPKKPRKITRLVRLSPRARDSHKGDFGRVLILGGSTGMLGAPALAANAAFRAGAGLVRVAIEGFLAGDLAALCPCATAIPYLITRSTWEFRDPSQRRPDPMADRQLMEVAWGVIRAAIQTNDVAAIGPGWGVDATRQYLLDNILASVQRPLVIDADGLNTLARLRTFADRVRDCIEHGGSIVLTPHPGEMHRLLESLGEKIDVRKNREKAALALAAATNAIVVLKGAGTIVTDGTRIYVNKSGNPGMATGGTGDILTGVIAGFIGQRLDPFDAAALGVFVHGTAGDLAAKQFGQVSLMATDLLDFLPQAIRAVSPKR